MPKRDIRWENVTAYIGLADPFGDDPDLPEGLIEIVIEVPHNGTLWWSRQTLSHHQYAQFNPEILGIILDEMVKVVDERMEGKRPNG